MNTLKRLRANVVGVVLNEVRANSSENYYYHYSPEVLQALQQRRGGIERLIWDAPTVAVL